MNWIPGEDPRRLGTAFDERIQHFAFDGLLDMSSLDGKHDRDAWWRSLDELADSPRFRTFLESEFPAAADPGGVNRRRWMQLMGASLALAAAGGCRWKKQDILPFTHRPEDRTPGQFERFATAMPWGDAVMGLEVTCVDGRPIKIEGNPRHPQSLGATDAFAQATLLELYDPDRSQSVTRQKGDDFQEQTWEEFEKAGQPLVRRLQETDGAGIPHPRRSRAVRPRSRRCGHGS